MTEGTTQEAANAAMTVGRSRSGKARLTVTYSATITSPPPTPCTARPSTKIHIVTAVPDSTSPAANPTMPVASGGSGPRRSHHWPEPTMPTMAVVKNAEKAYAYREMPFSSSAATGMAVPTAVASKAIISTTETMPSVSAR